MTTRICLCNNEQNMTCMSLGVETCQHDMDVTSRERCKCKIYFTSNRDVNLVLPLRHGGLE